MTEERPEKQTPPTSSDELRSEFRRAQRRRWLRRGMVICRETDDDGGNEPKAQVGEST